jgi:hypothetical protein
MKSSSGAPRDGVGDDAVEAGAGAGGAAMVTAHQAALTNSQCRPRIN